MDRRQFIKDLLLWSAGVAVSAPVFRIIPEALAAENPSPVVSVAEGKDYTALVSQVLEPLGGMSGFVKKGDKVVVKPNIGWDRSPEQAANTHPLVVQALVVQALEAGASRVLVFDRTCNEQRRCYANSGIEKAVKDIGDRRAVIEHIDNRKFVPVTIAKGKAINSWEIYKDALDCDCYINTPIAKNHGVSRLTLGLKNVMGVIGGNRGALHRNIGQTVADLATVVKPHLTVIDATRILLRNGPQGGNLNDVEQRDTLIASSDPVAADAYGATLFGMKPEDIQTTVEAYKLGLGEIDLEKVRIIGA